MSHVPVSIPDESLHYFTEGTAQQAYRDLGAHLSWHEGREGTRFAVWAPNARRVFVVGDFNGWDHHAHPMNHRGASGVWELFVPGVHRGNLYKFLVVGRHGEQLVKSDPYAFQAELRPKTASVVCDLDDYQWNDQGWMAGRGRHAPHEGPLAIYELHLGSWRRNPHEGSRFLTYRELTDEVTGYVSEMGFTHIELLPVAEHPLDQSWGYQVTGFFSVTSRYGTPQDFKHFVDRCHQKGIGVILDWVPAHFPKDGHALGVFDGTCLYEHADPRQGQHPDWDTYVFNYARNEIRSFLISNAHFWFDIYHIDGLRVDAVASMLYLDYSRKDGDWVPNPYGGKENIPAIELIRTVNASISARHPGAMMVAEESTAWSLVSHPVDKGGLGFHFKWNMGWMHDVLKFMSTDPIFRKHDINQLTFGLLYAFTENFILPLSHDEVVHGKRSLLDRMPGDLKQRFANLRLLLAYMYGHPGKKLLFMGGEFGQYNEWDAGTSLDWHLLQYETHQGVQRLVKDLNRTYRSEPALHQVDARPEGFEWIDFTDRDSQVISFIRRAKDPNDFLVCVFNLTPVPRGPYRIGVPKLGHYRELLNTDAQCYDGIGLGNLGGVDAKPVPFHLRHYSIEITVPPLSGLIFKPG
jgi:1,4-alpha-glucan branching enzyme